MQLPESSELPRRSANLPLSAADQVPSVDKFGLKSLWMSCCTPTSQFHFASCQFFEKLNNHKTNPSFVFLSRFDKLIWIANHFVMETLPTAHLNGLLNVTFLQLGQKLWNNWTDFLQENYRKCEFIVPDENIAHTVAISQSHRNENIKTKKSKHLEAFSPKFQSQLSFTTNLQVCAVIGHDLSIHKVPTSSWSHSYCKS